MEQLNDGEHRAFKDTLYQEFARVGAALGNKKRLEMIDLLAQEERSVQDLADEMSISVANASQHLQSLRAARLVGSRQEGTYRYYRLADETVVELWRALRDLASQQLSEIDAVVERHLGPREAVCTPDPTTLAEDLDDDVVLLDVRPAGEYRSGHLPGALSVPIGEIGSSVDELPDDKEFLVYCRGPFCVFSDEAVRVLRDRGREAYRLEPGLPDWKAMGVPVVTESEGANA